VTAYTSNPNTAVAGLTANIRTAGSNSVVRTIRTGEAHPGDPRARARLQPGRYVIDFVPPAGFDFAQRQKTSVELEVLRGRIAFAEVELVKRPSP
jgi:hypothetical protein